MNVSCSGYSVQLCLHHGVAPTDVVVGMVVDVVMSVDVCAESSVGASVVAYWLW